ncbi:hypothetical protein SAMN04490204_0337 [Pseudomonas thivervalensis]|nr:hypothetical protein SAMN04490204_0337 [Pseudomonas thivervalensis]
MGFSLTTGSNQPDLDVLQNNCFGATIFDSIFFPMLMRGSVE